MPRKNRGQGSSGKRRLNSPTRTNTQSKDLDSINLARDSNNGIIEDLADLYKKGAFCDLKLVCGSNEDSEVKCHRVVLAGLSPTLAPAMEPSELIGDEFTTILLPDYDYNAVRSVIDGIYGCLDDDWSGSASEHAAFQTVLDALSIDISSERPVEPLCDQDMDESTYTDLLTDSYVHADDMLMKKEEEDMDDDVFEPYLSLYDDTLDEKLDMKPSVPDKVDQDNVPSAKNLKRSTEKGYEIKNTENEIEKTEKLVLKLDQQMESSTGKLVVNVQNQPFDLRRYKSTKNNKIMFLAVFSVKKLEKYCLLAKPLLWSPPIPLTSSEHFRQYENVAEALKSIYGLSEIEAYCHARFRKQMAQNELNKVQISRCSVYISNYAKFTREQLQEVIDDKAISKACTPKPPKPSLFHSLYMKSNQDVVLKLTDDMPPETMDGLLCVSFNDVAELIGNILHIDESTRKINIQHLIHMVCAAWLLRTKEKNLGIIHELLEKIRNLSPLKDKYLAAKEYLDDPKGIKQLERNNETTCSECGRYFPLTTLNEKNGYKKAQR